MKLPDPPAPELQVAEYFNAPRPPSLAQLRGRVVVLHAFQMLCPACVTHGLPQASAIYDTFPASELAVIGLHSVFEHHAVMTPAALAAFLHEYRIRFPVAVDLAGTGGPIPRTMQAYGMRGTPTLIVLDRGGRIRLHQFGSVPDLRVGAVLGQLLAEPRMASDAAGSSGEPTATGGSCDPQGCQPSASAAGAE
jgi:hypothetical protein